MKRQAATSHRRARAGATALATLAWACAPARAAEAVSALREAPGRDLVSTRYVLCHSLEYVTMNAPLMTPALWEKTLTKMVRIMGAPVSAEEERAILDYLDANYVATR